MVPYIQCHSTLPYRTVPYVQCRTYSTKLFRPSHLRPGWMQRIKAEQEPEKRVMKATKATIQPQELKLSWLPFPPHRRSSKALWDFLYVGQSADVLHKVVSPRPLLLSRGTSFLLRTSWWMTGKLPRASATRSLSTMVAGVLSPEA